MNPAKVILPTPDEIQSRICGQIGGMPMECSRIEQTLRALEERCHYVAKLKQSAEVGAILIDVWELKERAAKLRAKCDALDAATNRK